MAQDNKTWLLNQIKFMSNLLQEGRYNEIDLTKIEKEAADMARNFGSVINSLKSAGGSMDVESGDIPLISSHLQHISKTTEAGVLKVLENVETVLDDSSKAKKFLEELKNGDVPADQVETGAEEAYGNLDEVKERCFDIMTSLEFEDINRQLLEKIIGRLDELYANLLNIILMLKFKESVDQKDSPFLDTLRHITDIENSGSRDQQMVDILLEEFDL